MRRIVWSPEALSDLEDIGEYIGSNASTKIAARFLGRIRQFVRDQLAPFPASRPECPELESGLRRAIVGQYLIFYTFDDKQLIIWRVLHGRRHITPPLIRP